jgi:hypothetical protein
MEHATGQCFNFGKLLVCQFDIGHPMVFGTHAGLTIAKASLARRLASRTDR